MAQICCDAVSGRKGAKVQDLVTSGQAFKALGECRFTLWRRVLGGTWRTVQKVK